MNYHSRWNFYLLFHFHSKWTHLLFYCSLRSACSTLARLPHRDRHRDRGLWWRDDGKFNKTQRWAQTNNIRALRMIRIISSFVSKLSLRINKKFLYFFFGWNLDVVTKAELSSETNDFSHFKWKFMAFHSSTVGRDIQDWVPICLSHFTFKWDR